MDVASIAAGFLSGKDARMIESSEALLDRVSHGFRPEEIAEVASAIAESGRRVRLPSELAPFADVASTGGPGSLTTLITPFLMSAVGVRVPKVSASGSIAGAIDTFAVLPGFRSQLDSKQFLTALSESGIAHTLQTDDFCPVDGLLIRMRRSRGLMACPELAAASLLAKKLAIPGTAVAFDFRVGESGNIGNGEDEARRSAQLFGEVSKHLGLRITILLTDNDTLPSTSLGRLESLHLFYEIVNGRQLGRLDSEHLQVCLEIAAEACALARHRPVHQESAAIRTALETGRVKDQLAANLEAQGSSLDELERVLDVRQRQEVQVVSATEDGYWFPPKAMCLKNWFRETRLAVRGDSAATAESEIGLRFLVSPGDHVEVGAGIAEIRFPIRTSLGPAGELPRGSVKPQPDSSHTQILSRMRFNEPT